MKIRRIVTLLCLLMIISIVSFAGNSNATNLGDQYYKQFDFKMALASYQKALKQDKNSTYLTQRIADCYRLINDWASAKPYYAELVSHNRIKPQNYIYYAQALREGKDYTQAKVYYAKYLEVYPEDSSVREQINWIDRTQELMVSHVVYDITNMKDINTPYSEFGVTFYGLNDIYFCSNRKPDNYVKRTDSWTNNPFLKIYAAQVIDSLGTLNNVSPLPSSIVNQKYHAAAPCYNEKLDELYFDQSNYDGKRAFFSADKTVKLKIYKVAYSPDADKWDGELKEAVPFNSREYSVCHPSLNKKGDTLYFTSDMPGGYGRADIYLSARQHDGGWGPPVNLGPGINTSGDDMFPFIAADGTLYFSSNGHVGIGGLDIFYSRFQKGEWTTPTNLGAPINSNMDDFGYVIRSNNKSGYFCSNRNGGAGDDDIYSFVRMGINISGITVNGNTGDSISGATVEMKLNTQKLRATSGRDGSFSFNAQPNFNYTFTAKKEGFREANIDFMITDSTRYVRIPMYADSSTLEVVVLDKKTHSPIDSVQMKLTKQPGPGSQVSYTNKEGKGSFAINPNSNYKLDAYKETGDSMEKYLRVTKDISTKGAPPVISEKVELDKVKKKVPIKIENIYYDLDKWDIRPDAAIELNKLVKILMDNPTMVIELSSHTDCRGTSEYNLLLSKLRAQSAVEYIKSQGIDRARMSAAGYGESRLVNNCKCEDNYEVPCSEVQHQANRRTEFKIMKF